MPNTLRTLLLAAMLAMSSGVASAGPFEDADAAYNRKDYATALKLWRPFADQGDAFAQYNLGLMYDNGEGVTENDAEAVKWYRKAADQGFAKAQVNLGAMYGNGEGVTENYVQAYKWFNIAAAQGEATAKSNKAFIENKMTREQIAEAQKLSAEWKPTTGPK